LRKRYDMSKVFFPSLAAYTIDAVAIPGKPKAKGKARGLLAFFIIASLIVCSLFYVWSRVLVINLGYELSEAMDKHGKLTQENKKLHIEVALLKSPARIERIAQEELNMGKPLPGQIILMK
jgi:cell division protein FtsL